MSKSYNFMTWAIDTGEVGFIGRFWRFGSNLHPDIPTHLLGCRIALFETRKEARRGLPFVKTSWPNAKVVRVTVTIKSEEP